MALARAAEHASLWDVVRDDAQALARGEPAFAAWMHEAILNHDDLGGALAQLIAVAIGGDSDDRATIRRIVHTAYRSAPALAATACRDLAAPLARDPACPGPLHVLLHFKGYLALQVHRVAHRLWLEGRRELARELSVRTARALHVSIHPSAVIGGGAFIDHGTGVTIGADVSIGDDLSMLQGVTVGTAPDAPGAPRIGHGVLLSAGAIVLGGIDVGDYAKVGAGSLVTSDVPSGCTAVGVPARLVNCSPDVRPASSMDQSLP
ncbi:serine acetyltransferase [Bradyrhizobium sp. U87765 SZCCT0131]|uniref:serine O-acetyltransferase n=1 Tax=unclassified Bradyrhizobium TaxID=2631580 RepID=UPI001BA98053|nr:MULTISPECIES: serine acetyltransferase [unclassified Bradyrhizobium]MBR1219527.1 serine acetyltransferase [Bradyrhizobium sp. U87765 SZCCT0131]MBR1262178.1 serine acetyltransferase [Bradyrhizobium sp. U87765 SZCCT0134]MBR1308639.1 serine acetyltransferase [Bradyrhizobium sp. U87765 SZCCT0110]MBR1317960.1 serine acetyltransferase [Bradyrhizobium sp. U87765 SZCCT0109]MBR1351663.1 serine acetyltransferase [Bradyrhizobium sp. U87765 SZCCT0048]